MRWGLCGQKLGGGPLGDRRLGSGFLEDTSLRAGPLGYRSLGAGPLGRGRAWGRGPWGAELGGGVPGGGGFLRGEVPGEQGLWEWALEEAKLARAAGTLCMGVCRRQGLQRVRAGEAGLRWGQGSGLREFSEL